MKRDKGTIQVYKDTEEMGVAAADYFIKKAKEAISSNGRFSVALSGGSTPGFLYKNLIKEEYKSQVDWSKVYAFWGDERYVPIEDDLSLVARLFEFP